MKFHPHAYQKYCIQRLVSQAALGLFLDMGLGKTVITLTAINDLRYNRFEIGKTLVIAPKKVAESTWVKEAEKWEHLRHLRISKILGSSQKRIRALNTPADIYVINRENIPWLVDYYRNDWPFDCVVVDELSSFKNYKAKRFKSLTWVRSKIGRIYGLTGTPVPNGLEDLWAQVYLLDEGQRLGKKISHYRDKYFSSEIVASGGIRKYYPDEQSETAVYGLIGDICVSMKAEDYLELPDFVSNTIPVILDDKALKAYKELEKKMVLELENTIIDAGSAAVLTNKLLQLCSGAIYDRNRGVNEIHNCKIEAFLETIEFLSGKPVIVFYYFQHDKDRILEALAGSGLMIKSLKTPADEEAWNRREVDVLLAHPASTAYGLNLQDGGNHIIWFSLNWSLELYQQANKRLHRQGQKQKVIAHHLIVEGGRDADVMAALQSKGDVQEALMQSLKARIDSYKEAV